MNSTLAKKILLISLVLLFSFFQNSLYSQYFEKDTTRKTLFQNIFINANGGLSLFVGDVQNDKGMFYADDWQLGAGYAVRKHFNPALSFGVQILNAKLQGTRPALADGTVVNWKFFGDVFEYNFHGVLNFTNLFAYKPKRVFTIYAMAGVGMANWASQLTNFQTANLINEVGVKGQGIGARRNSLVYPVGLGIQFNLNHNFGINLESTLRFLRVDDLDANVVADTKNDYYSYTSLGISMRLLPRKKNTPEKDTLAGAEEEVEEEEKTYPADSLCEDMQAIIRVLCGENIDTVAKKYGMTTEELQEKNDTFLEGGKNAICPDTIYTEEKDSLYGRDVWIGDTAEAYVQEDVYYTVQILAKYENIPQIEYLKRNFNVREHITMTYHDDNLYRYTVGPYETFEQARNHYREIKAKGITDAFIVKNQNGQRIPIWDYQIEYFESNNAVMYEQPAYEQQAYEVESDWDDSGMPKYSKEEEDDAYIDYSYKETPKPEYLRDLPMGNRFYTIQILAKRKPETKFDYLRYSYNIRELIYVAKHEDNIYRYTVGWYVDFQQAQRYLRELHNKGLFDAFIVKYENGIRRPVN